MKWLLSRVRVSELERCCDWVERRSRAAVQREERNSCLDNDLYTDRPLMKEIIHYLSRIQRTNSVITDLRHNIYSMNATLVRTLASTV